MLSHIKIAVIGGGISGLCAAYYASKEWGNESVRLYESGEHSGGKAWTDYDSGYQCEWGPNGFLDKEPLTLQWIDDLGLTAELIQANEAAAKRFIFKNEKLYQIKAPPAFFFSDLLSLRARFRLFGEFFVPAKKDSSPETIRDFAARRIGPEAADTLVCAMVQGVFGGDAAQLSLEHCFPRMAQMEREHGGLVRAMLSKSKDGKKAGGPSGPGGKLTSFRKGIRQLIEKAEESLTEQTVYNSSVINIEKNDKIYQVKFDDGSSVIAEKVIIASPAYAAAGMLRDIDIESSESLDAIPYSSIAVLCAGYKREKISHTLDGFGFLIPPNQNKKTLGCLWTSSIFDNRAPDDQILLRFMMGGPKNPDLIDEEDSSLTQTVIKECGEVLGLNTEPDFLKIYRHKMAIPQYTIGHGERIKVIEETEKRHEGFVFAGNSYRGVSVNDCVVSAHRAVDLLKSR